MGMRLDINSDLWRDIYNGIRRDFYHNNYGMTRTDMEQHLSSIGITVIKDVGDGRWQEIYIADHADLMEIYLRWA